MKKSTPPYRFGFIGIGRMAEVILRSILRAKLAKPQEIIVSRTSSSALKKLSRELHVATTTNNQIVSQQCSILWIGVKPYQAQEVLEEIRPVLNSKTTLLSIMAGISTQFLKNNLKNNSPVIRLMPNTPALLGEGMTGVFFTKETPSSAKKLILKVLGVMGKVFVCSKEKELDAITGLSGSGVAFVYHLAQGLMEGGIRSGLKANHAQEGAIQTLRGAIRMLEASGKKPEELVQQVVSKGGTTEAGLKVLKNKKTAEALAQAVVEATQRAEELREENEKCSH